MEPSKKRIAHKPIEETVLTKVELIISRTKSKLSESNPIKGRRRPKPSPQTEDMEKEVPKEKKALLAGSAVINKIMDKKTLKTKVHGPVINEGQEESTIIVEGPSLRKRTRNFTYNENVLQDRYYNEAMDSLYPDVKKVKIIVDGVTTD